MEPKFRVQRFDEQAQLVQLSLGRPLHVTALTGSTNDDALTAARNNAPHGATFVADAQTAGRGRRGSAWLSQPGENLLFSVLLRPRLQPDQASGFALAAGLAVYDAVTPFLRTPAKIKWPNDVLVEDKKLAGILVESQVQGNALSALVVGIGVNVSTREFPEAIAARATSLAVLGADITREELLVQLLAALERRCADYERQGIAGISEELRVHDALLGKLVRVDQTVGYARGIDSEGRLIVEDAAGKRHAIIAGSVEFYAA